MQGGTANPGLFGLPAEIVIFTAILLGILLSAPLLLPLLGGNQKIRRRATALRKRLSHEAKQPKDAAASRQPQGLRRQTGDTSLPLLTTLFSYLPNIGQLRSRLERAGLSLSAERYLMYSLAIFAFAALVLMRIMQLHSVVALLLALTIGMALPHLFVGMRIAKRVKQFLILFPDALDLIVRGLRAGLPVTESIKMVSREIDEPVGGIFRAITEKMALGVPLEQTLYETAAKYRITEFDFFVTSLSLQRETGGNLSEILNNLSTALRQRTMMRLKIKAMSSEARASMYIIGALPFMVMGALFFTSPGYLQPLFDDFRGNIALAVAGGMLGTGIFIMLRMAKFEI